MNNINMPELAENLLFSKKVKAGGFDKKSNEKLLKINNLIAESNDLAGKIQKELGEELKTKTEELEEINNV